MLSDQRPDPTGGRTETTFSSEVRFPRLKSDPLRMSWPKRMYTGRQHIEGYESHVQQITAQRRHLSIEKGPSSSIQQHTCSRPLLTSPSARMRERIPRRLLTAAVPSGYTNFGVD